MKYFWIYKIIYIGNMDQLIFFWKRNNERLSDILIEKKR